MAIHPESEDILAISGLMAMSRQEWRRAIGLFEELIDVQVENPQPYTHLMLIRAMRCEGEVISALSICIQAHELFTQHPELEHEFAGLSKVLGFAE